MVDECNNGIYVYEGNFVNVQYNSHHQEVHIHDCILLLLLLACGHVHTYMLGVALSPLMIFSFLMILSFNKWIPCTDGFYAPTLPLASDRLYAENS